jgi:hypothetical protein
MITLFVKVHALAFSTTPYSFGGGKFRLANQVTSNHFFGAHDYPCPAPEMPVP